MEKNTIVRSLAYKFTERFAVKGLGFVISIVLARLLAPEVFGQVALLTVFTDLSLTLIDSGLSTALVQTREANERDYSTVFLITLALSCVMIAILQLTAPAIARYFRSEELLRPLRFFSFSLLLSAFNSIQVARMQREMRFREMMFCNLAATVLAGSLGVCLAFRGAGLWALVGYFFGQIAVSSLAMLYVLRWFPRERFSPESAKKLYGFGLKMLAASIVTTVYNNLRPLIIGRRFSTAELGYFNRGQTFASTVSLNLDAAIQSVMFPVLSRAQDEPAALLALLRRTKKLGCFLIFPVMFGMAAAAEPIVRVVLTDKWLPAVPFLILMSVGEAQVPLTSSNLVALKSLGRSDLYARQEVLRRVLMLLVLAISVLGFHTVPAIAAGFAFSAWLDAWVTSLPLKKLLGYGARDQLRDVWKSLLASLLMAGAVRAFGLLPLPQIFKLLAQIILGLAVYLLTNRLLGNESLNTVLSLLRSRRPNPEETP